MKRRSEQVTTTIAAGRDVDVVNVVERNMDSIAILGALQTLIWCGAACQKTHRHQLALIIYFRHSLLGSTSNVLRRVLLYRLSFHCTCSICPRLPIPSHHALGAASSRTSGTTSRLAPPRVRRFVIALGSICRSFCRIVGHRRQRQARILSGGAQAQP